MDIQILCERFCEYSLSIRGYSKATICRYSVVIKSYCRIAQISELSQITNENLRALFYYGRTARKWSVNTYIVYYKSLSIFFKWCMTEGCLSTNPMVGIEKPKLENRLPTKLRKQDAFRLLEVVFNYPYDSKFLRYRNHAIFSIFLFAGLRKQELLNLKYTDVDIENRTIFIRQGKGNKDRFIPISHTLAQSLLQYVKVRKEVNKTCPEFFASSNRAIGYTSHGLKRLVTQINEASGIKFNVHKLRHTFATLMLEGGCDIYSLSKMMGHSDIRTTTIYLSASADHLRAQMTKHPLNNCS